MIDPLPIWIVEWEKLPQDSTGNDSPKNITTFLNDRVTNKLDLDNSIVKFTPPPQFTWQKGLFENLFKIISKTPSFDPITPAIKIATAWQTATLASTMMISSGAQFAPPLPPSNGIVAIAAAVIDPATLAIAYTGIIADLSSGTPAEIRSKAVFPKALFKAFSSITFTVSGIDTTLPPPAGIGPVPFVYPLTKVM